MGGLCTGTGMIHAYDCNQLAITAPTVIKYEFPGESPAKAWLCPDTEKTKKVNIYASMTESVWGQRLRLIVVGGERTGLPSS